MTGFFCPPAMNARYNSARTRSGLRKGTKPMFNSRTLLKLLVLACVLVASAVAASPPASTNQPSPDAMKTALQPDLSLKSAISPDALFTTEQLAVAKRHGFCRCSCGYPCETSADCGGVSCDPFISCCEKTTSPDVFENGVSSRKDGQPAINIKCK